MVRISGASFCTTCSVRQSNDWIMSRRSIPPLRISAITRRANSSGGSVAAGSSGEILVSQSKPILSLPDFFTRSKRSDRRGIRVPSTGFWSGKPFAYSVPGLSRPTS